MSVLPLGAVDEEDVAALCSLRQRDGSQFRIISVGRLLGWKGFALGLEAFAMFRRQCPESEYWVIGDGPEMRHLRRLAERVGCYEQVRFLGWRPRREVLGLLEASHVVVHPSFHEGVCYAVLEAMLAGRPVISLDVSGPGFFLRDGRGFLVAPGKPRVVAMRIAQSLHALRSSAVLRFSVGQAARQWIRTNWSWSAVADAVEKIYSEEIAGLERQGRGAEPSGD